MTIEEIFNQAVILKASDIHLAVGSPVFFRINGNLQPGENNLLIKIGDVLSLIRPIINQTQEEKLFREKNLEFSYRLKNNIRLRVSVFFEKNNLALAARLIWPKIPSMQEINLPEAAYKLADIQDGLILITGPTGSGKSTTMAAIIDYINEKKPYHIITLEDPIEFVFSSKKGLVVQRELGQDMISFDSALKHIVRQDPDVVLVSELRDLETISLAVTLAETGHLILATLHTPNASQTVDRIIDIFPADQQKQIRLQVAMALKGIISQHLLPRMGGGLIAAREVLINTPAVANLIRENKTAQIRSAMQTGSKDGMFTLEQDLKKLYRDGLVSLETALSYSNCPEEILKE
jgi:twitching motility protein PilT